MSNRHPHPSETVLVLLCGSGVFDGSEIHEATLSLLSLDLEGISYQCIAPPLHQSTVINHMTKTPTEEKRNALIEAARISRGDIIALDVLLKQGALEHYGALLIPGGYGVATTLSDYAKNSDNMTLEPLTDELLTRWLTLQKPCMATCLAPILLAKAARKLNKKIKLTLGESREDKLWLDSYGMDGVIALESDCVIDKENKIITTPAYMNPSSIATVWKGISNGVKTLKEFMNIQVST